MKDFYCKEFARKKFSGETMKDAYMKAVKWFATNVLSKDELRNVKVEFEKDKQFPTVTVRLSVSVDEREVMNQHCRCCKEMHSAFFINENTSCSSCSAAAYRRRMTQKIVVKTNYYKECLEKYTDLEDVE